MHNLPPFSFECLPDMQALTNNVYTARLRQLSTAAQFIGVSCSAASPAKQRHTLAAVEHLRSLSAAVMPHLSCAHLTTVRARHLLDRYRQLHIRKLLIVGGDAPQTRRDFPDAVTLIAFIKQHFPDLTLYAAVNPTPPYRREITRLQEKAAAGAEAAIAQFCFIPGYYADFKTACRRRGLNLPVIPGILAPLPPTRLQEICRRCRVAPPSDLDSPSYLHTTPLQHTMRLCRSLIESDASQLHFYTLNELNCFQELLDVIYARN